MFRNVLLKSLRDQRRSLVGWSVGLIVLVVLMAGLWPSVRDMPNIDEFLANYPDAMKDLFNIDAMTTGAGYLNAELFTMILPALFIIFCISRGARAIAGEEEGGTLEALLVTPFSRTRILLEKAGAIVTSTVGLGAVLFAVTVAASALIDMEIAIVNAAVGSVAMVLLGVQHGMLALAVGAATGRRGLAIAVSTTYALAGYLLFVLGTLVDAIEPWQPLSPFHQALRDGPLGGGLPASFAWLAVVAVVFLAAAVPTFDRRDVATA